MIRPLSAFPNMVTDVPDPGRSNQPAMQCVGEVNVLVIDDEPDICDLIRRGMAPYGFQVDVAHRASDIEHRLMNQTYHLVILDYVIPGLEFEQVAQWLQTSQPDAGIIVITGYPSIESALTCLRAHTFDYLIKPLKMDDLRDVVTRCLESKGLLRMSEAALRECLGTAIRERRKSLGLTLAQLAERTDLSVGYLSQIELGKNSASIEALYRISLGLGIKLAELFQSIRMSEPSGP